MEEMINILAKQNDDEIFISHIEKIIANRIIKWNPKDLLVSILGLKPRTSVR